MLGVIRELRVSRNVQELDAYVDSIIRENPIGAYHALMYAEYNPGIRKASEVLLKSSYCEDWAAASVGFERIGDGKMADEAREKFLKHLQ